MKCPLCAADLVMSDRQGIEVDYCVKCRGIWLDRGEIDTIIERSQAAEAPRAVLPPQPAAPGGFAAPHPSTGHPPPPRHQQHDPRDDGPDRRRFGQPGY